MSEEVITEPPGGDVPDQPTQEAHQDVQPVIHKKRGRPKGWKKRGSEFRPTTPEEVIAAYPPKDEMTMLKEELSFLKNQMAAMRNQNTVTGPQVEGPAFKGRGLPSPLPEGFPEIDPMAGDKTPAVVEWFRDNDPEEFAKRYKGRVMHLKPKAGKGGEKEFILDEETGQRIKMMARTEGKTDLNLSPRTYGG